MITSDGAQLLGLDVERVVNFAALLVVLMRFARDSVLQVLELQHFVSWTRDSMKLSWVTWLAGEIGCRQISFRRIVQQVSCKQDQVVILVPLVHVRGVVGRGRGAA